MTDSNSDRIWNHGQPGSQLTLEERELEFQRVRRMIVFLWKDELRTIRARLGDLTLSGKTRQEELLALRGRIIDEEIKRRERSIIGEW